MNARRYFQDAESSWSPALTLQTVMIGFVIIAGFWTVYTKIVGDIADVGKQVSATREQVAALTAAFNAHLAEPKRADAGR
jgi:hypothetical protein